MNRASAVTREFSRFASEYDRYNIIQTELARLLIGKIPSKSYDAIVDVGCGSGVVYHALQEAGIVFSNFFACDISPQMLARHPSGDSTKKIVFDFNQSSFFSSDIFRTADIVISSSALQWSEDLSSTLNDIASLHKPFYTTLFTSSTFLALHTLAGIQSPIYALDDIVESFQKYFDISYEVVHYKLYFEETKDLFHYIKRSGVSGGKNLLSVGKLRALMRSYPLDYLEFEAVIVEAKSLLR